MSKPGELFLLPDPPSDWPRGTQAKLPDDQPARDAALDVSRSWIVQAPAGAGKTELLTQRFLKLLTIVDEPEEILAITFTRAATAEMRRRILEALEEAAATEGNSPLHGDAEPRTLTLAHAALKQSNARNWQLLEQPHRLDVQTIDSLCLRLAHGQPLLSRLGGRLDPTEQAAPLYARAARRTFGLLGSAPAELEAALQHLLIMRDNNLGECQRLIAQMLESREQWRHIFVLSEQHAVDWEEIRARLEAPFAREIQRILSDLRAAFTDEPALAGELLELAQYACSNGGRAEIGLLHGLQAMPATDAAFVGHWACLRSFLLTDKGKWRKSLNRLDGFPVEGASRPRAEQLRYKQRMTGLIEDLHRDEAAGERLRVLLCSVPALPTAHYSEPQWQTLRSIFRVLRHAVAELHVVFAERNEVDFAELSIAAATVLDEEESTRGLLASEARRHLLIDEFQDTSRRQHQLIGRLLREWRPDDGRTCFLVGDPMQSIYIFREAEVELFGRVQRRGLDCGSHAHPCSALTLSQNFRSHAGLVKPLNEYFTAIFAASRTALETRGDVPFSPSNAAASEEPGEAVQVHTFFATSDKRDRQARRVDEVRRIVSLVEQQMQRVKSAEQAGEKSYTVAILGRAKSHLAPIAAALRAQDIPFRGVELETLAERQEIIDLHSLLRALLHPADRIAWLSVLRAPWCGLTLGDLHTLTGADDKRFRYTPVTELIEAHRTLLTEDGQARLARVVLVLERAAADRFRGGRSLATWLERAWVSLGAPAYLGPAERANAEVFFGLLDSLASDGVAVFDGSLQTALERLCASPDAEVSERFGVQLMTIHKAKGLGFDVVIVPALERAARDERSPLVTILERVRSETGEPRSLEGELDEVLVAPLGRHGEQHRTYDWVKKQRRLREAGERKRVFYVACTRARRQLHLLGIAGITANGLLNRGASDSLLACAWPALGPLFEAQRSNGQAEPAASPGVQRLVPAATSVNAPGPMLVPAAVTLTEAAAEPGVLPGLAAGAASGAEEGLRLLRVPSTFSPRVLLENVTTAGTDARAGSSTLAEGKRLERPEGSFEQRARGNAVHAMLELVSEVWALKDGSRSSAEAERGTAGLEPQLLRVSRAVLLLAGLAPSRVDSLSAHLVGIVLAAAAHEEGRWILGPHEGAQSEATWSQWLGASAGSDARLRTLRVDRIFRGGSEPLSKGSTCLWIIDYKTGAGPGGIALEAYLEGQKQQWRPQLEAYGAALRDFHRDKVELRYGLYFPELLRLISWSA